MASGVASGRSTQGRCRPDWCWTKLAPQGSGRNTHSDGLVGRRRGGPLGSNGRFEEGPAGEVAWLGRWRAPGIKAKTGWHPSSASSTARKAIAAEVRAVVAPCRLLMTGGQVLGGATRSTSNESSDAPMLIPRHGLGITKGENPLYSRCESVIGLSDAFVALSIGSLWPSRGGDSCVG